MGAASRRDRHLFWTRSWGDPAPRWQCSDAPEGIQLVEARLAIELPFASGTLSALQEKEARDALSGLILTHQFGPDGQRRYDPQWPARARRLFEVAGHIQERGDDGTGRR